MTSSSVLLNASYHKKYEYVWFMGGGLYSFQDIKPFMNLKGWGMPVHTRGTSLSVLLNAPYHFVLFDLILYVQSTIFKLYRDGSSWVEPVLG